MYRYKKKVLYNSNSIYKYRVHEERFFFFLWYRMQYLTVSQPPEAYIFRKTKLISLYGTFQNPHHLISKFTLFNSSPVLSDASLWYTLVFLLNLHHVIYVIASLM